MADALGFGHLDSGALYRAVTLAALDAEVGPSGEEVVALARSRPVRLVCVRGTFVPEVSGVDVSLPIRSDRVTERVSAIAALPAVRAWANEQLRAAIQLHPRGVVCDGRDVGTVIFPEAQLKIFLTASVEERARRRAREAGSDQEGSSLERVGSQLSVRDQADSTRAVAPLTPAKDAIHLDTTDMTFDDQVARIVEMARKVF